MIHSDVLHQHSSMDIILKVVMFTSCLSIWNEPLCCVLALLKCELFIYMSFFITFNPLIILCSLVFSGGDCKGHSGL